MTPQAALPKPDGTVIKNDRNLFLAMKQAEGLTCHHRRRTFSHLKPPEPQEKNFFAKIQSISSKLDVRRDPRGCKERRRAMPGAGGRQGDTLGVRGWIKVLCLRVSLSLGSWRDIAISFRWGKIVKSYMA